MSLPICLPNQKEGGVGASHQPPFLRGPCLGEEHHSHSPKLRQVAPPLRIPGATSPDGAETPSPKCQRA